MSKLFQYPVAFTSEVAFSPNRARGSAHSWSTWHCCSPRSASELTGCTNVLGNRPYCKALTGLHCASGQYLIKGDVFGTLLAVQTAMVDVLHILLCAKPTYDTGMTQALQMVHIAPLTVKWLH